MCKLEEEKRKYLEIEERLRKKLAGQWKQLRDIVTQPIMYAFMIHPKQWGHRTRSWRRSGLLPPTQGQQQHDDHPAPHNRAVPPPLVLPPVPREADTYENISTILTSTQCQEGYWEVDCDDVECEDSESTASVGEGEEDKEITVEVNEVDAYSTPDADSNATPILVACPPPFLTVYDYPQSDIERDFSTTMYEEDDYSSRFQEEDSETMADILDEYDDPQEQPQEDFDTVGQVQCEDNSCSYNQEFSDFYAKYDADYEKGADYLYYEDYGDPDEG